MYQIMLRADEWKRRYDLVCRDREATYRSDLAALRASLEDAYHKERTLALFWRGKFKGAEDKVHEIEAHRREEADRWKGCTFLTFFNHGVLSCTF